MEPRVHTRPIEEKEFKSDASYFVVYADPSSDLNPVVLCADCEKRAVGANFEEFFSGGPSGRPSGIVKFSCGCAFDGKQNFAISATSLFPQWRLISEVKPGVWRIVKTSKDEREKLCKK
jgi:hypothetical protein